MSRTIRSVWAALVVGSSLAVPLFAAAPVFTNNFTAVTLDGVRLGTDTDPSNFSMFPSVVFDPSSGLFHMWVANTSALSIEGLRHATSADGVHFVSDGNLSFAGGSPFPAYGAATEPQFEFPRAAKIGSDWKLLIWTENNPSVNGDYNYNESVNDIGVDPSTLAVTHEGPIYPTDGTGTFGQTTGPYGIVDGKLYVADDRIGGLSKWQLDDAAPPSVTPPADTYQDLITGTGYVYFLTHPGDPLGVYVHNVARVLDQGDGTLGVYYSLRHPDGSRVEKQIYYAQSGDGGQTWSTPVGLFANGDAVRVDGAPNTFPFSHPEVTLVGTRRVLYFSTKAADGAYVVATSAAQPAPTSWADILGSGVMGDGERGVAVVRPSEGGYVVLASTAGLPPFPGFWLVRLDESGEVVWQRAYAPPFPGLFVASSIVETADGGFALSGSTGSGPFGMSILRVDSAGAVLWAETIAANDPVWGAANSAEALVATSDGGVGLAGQLADNLGIVKLDASGGVQWARMYPAGATPGNGWSYALSMVQAPDGGYLVGAASPTGRVLKVDSSGNIQWEQTGGEWVANRPSGGFVVVDANFAAALHDDGTVEWSKSYAGMYPSAITPAPSGGLGIVGGGVVSAIGVSGEPLWQKIFAALPSSQVELRGVVASSDGGLVAVGRDTVGSDFHLPDNRVLAVKVDAGGGFVGCLDVEQSVPFTATPASFTPVTIADTPVDETSNTTVTPLPINVTLTDASERVVCRAALPPELVPAALGADPQGNGVADPGERFVVSPSWTNYGPLATSLLGHTSPVEDTNGLDTSDPDVDASYGSVPSFATSDCLFMTDDCYQFGFLNIPRPAQHWDTTFDETLSTSDPHHRWAKRWTVHAGLSFSDVSSTSGFYRFVENIFHNGITGGCGTGIFCPTAPVTRAQMSVFLLKSKHGESFVPPACTGDFADVPCPSLFADWIEELAAEGITAGCGAGNYCPNDAVTRQQMAVFLLKALNGSSYAPPACTAIFGDVDCSSPFATWVEDLYNRQITAGCSASPLLYCPTAPNTREQMAVFLTKTFSLLLYGP